MFISRRAVSFTFAAVVIAAAWGVPTPARAAVYNPQPITSAEFRALTSVQVVPSWLAPLSPQSTGAVDVESRVYAGAGDWQGQYVYTYQITGDRTFALTFEGGFQAPSFYIEEGAVSRPIPNRVLQIFAGGSKTNWTLYFDGPRGLTGSSAVFGYLSDRQPQLTGVDSLSAGLDTQRALAYYAVPLPAALPLFLTALAWVNLAGRLKGKSPKGARGSCGTVDALAPS